MISVTLIDYWWLVRLGLANISIADRANAVDRCLVSAGGAELCGGFNSGGRGADLISAVDTEFGRGIYFGSAFFAEGRLCDRRVGVHCRSADTRLVALRNLLIGSVLILELLIDFNNISDGNQSHHDHLKDKTNDDGAEKQHQNAVVALPFLFGARPVIVCLFNVEEHQNTLYHTSDGG